ncbi:thiol:disulfide interchange protein DsbE [Aurantivibrio infirmus]
MNRLKLFIPLIIFVGFAVMVWQVRGTDPEAFPSALLGKSVPAFSLPAVADTERMITNNDIETPDYALINVWATWCGPCRIEHPYLVSLAESGVKIFGINGKDDLEAARKWLSEKGDPYQFSVFDEEGRLALDLGVTGYPETFLIDKNGTIIHKRVSVMDERVWKKEFLPLIENL